MVTRDQNQHAWDVLHHSGTRKDLTNISQRGIHATPNSKLWKLLSGHTFYDINVHPTNANNHPASFFLNHIIADLCFPLTFLWAEPEPITKRIASVHAALIRHIMQRPPTKRNTFLLLLPPRPHCYTFVETHCPSSATTCHARWV